MTDYEQQAKDFLKHTNSQMTISRYEIVNRFPGDKTATGNRWSYHIKIRRNGKSFSSTFYDSINNFREGKRPTQYDVLACLQKYEVDSDPWQFGDEYGYEVHCKEDYDSLIKTHKAVQNEYKKLRRLYADVWDEFEEIN